MFGISGTELMIILFFGFLIFGPEKLPQMGRTVGRAIRQFRDASEAASKKFKEEVADPFQEAIAPYKDQVEETTKPFQDDIAAINSTLNETKSMFTDPFKDILSPTPAKTSGSAGAVIAGGIADDPQSDDASRTQPEGSSAQDDAIVDPFAGVVDDASERAESDAQDANAKEAAPAGEAKPLPRTGGTVKKSLAASLYGLDDAEGGE